jgi:hypothetical protein
MLQAKPFIVDEWSIRLISERLAAPQLGRVLCQVERLGRIICQRCSGVGHQRVEPIHVDVMLVDQQGVSVRARADGGSFARAVGFEGVSKPGDLKRHCLGASPRLTGPPHIVQQGAGRDRATG